MTKAVDIYGEIVKNVKTNFSLTDAAYYALAAKTMNPDNIESFSMPGYGGEAYTRYGYTSCFLFNIKETEQLIETHFSLPADGQPKE